MPNVAIEQTATVRRDSMGCWTGWVADMQLIKNVKYKTSAESFIENYPRDRAISLNTWLSRFGMLSNGAFLELDRHGSGLVKEVIKRSRSKRGFLLRVAGYRRDNRLIVKSVTEIVREASFSEPDLQRMSQLKLRGEFGRMGI